MTDKKLIKAICILAGAVISASHSKSESNHHKSVIEHADKFYENVELEGEE